MTAFQGSPLRSLLLDLLPRIAAALRRQRSRGRSADGDLLAGLVIEEGEASGLLGVLAADLTSPPACPPHPDPRQTDRGAIARACARFELDPTARTALALALGVEVDGRIARLVGYLNDHPGHVRPTLALLWEIAEVPVGSERLALLESVAIRDGLFEVSGDGPLSTRELRVPAELVSRLCDGPDTAALRWSPPGAGLASLLLPDEPRRRAASWVDAARRGTTLPLVIEGPPGSGRTALARAALSELGLGAVHGPASGLALRREARWRGCGIVTPIDAGADPAAWWAALEPRGVPVAIEVTAGQSAALRAAMAVEPVTVRLAIPDTPTRSRLWRASAVGERLGAAQADALAARFPFTPGRIRRAAERAAAQPWTEGLLDEVCRDVGASTLGGLARRLPRVYRREHLVLPEALERELDLALSWVRHRAKVLGEWQLGARLANGWGVTAVLAGPPGTGKTMAAQVLGQELDADVYRVDLSQVVSKFIGETEKHLGALFDDASAAGAVLLFDEADALFGRRSEVRDARDRYANLEVGFLLQRIEDHDGVVLLSSNRMGDMDEAFLRRFHFVLTFPMPDRALRERIWRGLLPSVCAGDVDPASLADRFQVAGGEIRNAVLAASFMAAAEGAEVRQAHLVAALRREIHKSGRVLRASERAD